MVRQWKIPEASALQILVLISAQLRVYSRPRKNLFQSRFNLNFYAAARVA
jgi:hypothetical protein